MIRCALCGEVVKIGGEQPSEGTPVCCQCVAKYLEAGESFVDRGDGGGVHHIVGRGSRRVQ